MQKEPKTRVWLANLRLVAEGLVTLENVKVIAYRHNGTARGGLTTEL